ncbi:hypothetical protein [Novilysobacter selenitireducens]|uniref:Uncharacterized protein n=1 Tax=Novilysobacter selenitireducens TaxID=2872639 RepID=A0ABS7T608_9GAMM|nr:hypothetical protein [Lysobacter selenitireducens]MBZ4039310.1 hypothetical protein [Lysobacter selenitireducens]
MNREKIWEAMSYAWTEIGLSGAEFEKFAREIQVKPEGMSEFNRAVFWDTCGTFAIESTFAFLSLGVSLPDWHWPDAVERVARWRRRSVLQSLLNPIWLIGYPLACIMALNYWLQLRRAVTSSMYAA